MLNHYRLLSLLVGFGLFACHTDSGALPATQSTKNATENALPHQQSQGQSAADFTAQLKHIIQLAEQENWQEILTIASYFDAKSADSLDYILFQSLSHDSPVRVVQALLKQGASFQPHFINILAQKNNVQLAKALVPLGLDLHGADLFGRNALHHALEDFQSKEMFDYLISEKVAVDAKMGDKDPLAIALKRTLTHQDGVYYVNQLLLHEAPILRVHESLLEQVKQQNLSAYQLIQLP